MTTNQTRRRISSDQEELLKMLDDGPRAAKDLRWMYSDPRSIKRSLRRLERWGLVRLWYAPHPDAGTDWRAADLAYFKRWEEKWGSRRVRGGARSPGNLDQPVLWAERL